MSGCVGVIANDAGRYTLFSMALSQLQKPVNTQALWHITSDRIMGRNGVVKDALAVGAEWLLFLDDDHTFPPDTLMRLLSHDLPVVGALYLQRQKPFRPIAYSEKAGTWYKHLRLPDLPNEGLVPVRAMGTGGMLIRSEVFRQIEYPWFEHGLASEDLMFCDKVHELGIEMFIDAGVRLGHLATSAMWPSYWQGKWTVGFHLADGFALHAPIAEDDEPEPPEPS